ncbi:MAG: alkaline phosphatase family protein [Bythopirellula sp.]
MTAVQIKTLLVLVTVLCSFFASVGAAAETSRYVWLVTLDGLRLQELFTGADQRLIDEEVGGVKDVEAVKQRYLHESAEVRRRRLMPFFWEVISQQGQVFGSPEANSAVWVKNGRYFSYPGYQELLCGFPDEAIDSNDKKYNKNTSVLEWLHEQPDFHGKVAAFTSWDVFPYILNSKRSKMYVNAGWQEIEFTVDDTTRSWLNHAMREAPRVWPNVRFDFITHSGAMQYLRMQHPHVLYLALGETDDWCHEGRYDLYLDAARLNDRYLQQLWEFAQNSEIYRGKTSLVVASDHGRGDGREGWKSHSDKLPGSERTWIAVMGPDVPALGVRRDVEVDQGQVAATVAALLGQDFAATSPRIAPPLPIQDQSGDPSGDPSEGRREDSLDEQLVSPDPAEQLVSPDPAEQLVSPDPAKQE